MLSRIGLQGVPSTGMSEAYPPGSFERRGEQEPSDPTRADAQPPVSDSGYQPQPSDPTSVYPTYGQPQGYPQQYPQTSGYSQPQSYWRPEDYPQPYQPGGYAQPTGYGYPTQQAYPPQPAYPGYGYGAPYGQPAAYGTYSGVRQRRRTFGYVAAAVTVIGGIILMVAFTAVDWVSQSGNHATFPDIRRAMTRAANPPALPHGYFIWLAWVLLAAVVVFGIAGALPTPAHPALRIFGASVGIAGIVLTYLAYYKLTGLGFDRSLQGASVGPYLAAGGFLVAAIGASIGPHRATRAV